MKEKHLLLMVAALFALVYILPLGARPLIMPDEVRYGEIPREMLATGDWIAPRLNGVRYFEKPPLFYWANALSIRAFGENAFALRIVSALSAAVSAIVIFRLCRRFAGDFKTSLLSAVVFLTSAIVFMIGTFNVLDSFLTMLLTATLASFFFGYSSEKKGEKALCLALSGVFCGMAFLTKGFLAFAIPAVVIVPFLLWERRWRGLFTLPWIPGAAALAAALPWSVAVHFREPDFWNYFFWVEHVKRFMPGQNVFQHPEPFWFYLPVLLVGVALWTFLLPCAAMGLSKDVFRTPFYKYLVCWGGGILLFYSASSGKIPTYVLPCVAPMAVIIATGLLGYFKRGGHKTFDAVANTLAGLFFVAGLVFVILQFAGGQKVRIYTLPDEMTKLALATAAVGLMSMMMLMAGRSADGGRKLAFFAASLVPVMFCCHFLLPQKVEDGKAPGHFLMKHAERVKGDSIIVNYNMTRSLCWFYKRSDIIDTVGRGELEYGYSYPEAKNRFMPVEELAKTALDKSRAKPLFVFCRTKIYNKDIKPFMPDPKFVSMEHDFVIAEY